MCIRDRLSAEGDGRPMEVIAMNPASGELLALTGEPAAHPCLLYTSDAADERSSVDLGGRRIIKKKKEEYHYERTREMHYQS